LRQRRSSKGIDAHEGADHQKKRSAQPPNILCCVCPRDFQSQQYEPEIQQFVKGDSDSVLLILVVLTCCGG